MAPYSLSGCIALGASRCYCIEALAWKFNSLPAPIAEVSRSIYMFSQRRRGFFLSRPLLLLSPCHLTFTCAHSDTVASSGLQQSAHAGSRPDGSIIVFCQLAALFLDARVPLQRRATRAQRRHMGEVSIARRRMCSAQRAVANRERVTHTM
jgi:hypothetical protein